MNEKEGEGEKQKRYEFTTYVVSAIDRDDPDALQLLIQQYHGSYFATNLFTRRQTALAYACITEKESCVKVLLESGLSPYNAGIPVFYDLVYASHIGILRMLLESKGSQGLANVVIDASYFSHAARGRLSLLDYAFETGTARIVHLLIDHGANIYDTSNWKRHEQYVEIQHARNACRVAALMICKTRLICDFPSVQQNDVNVFRLIAKHVWSTRVVKAYIWVDTHNIRRDEEEIKRRKRGE